ncbi:MAG: DNA replication and repair protein RecF [Pyramidobacter sp.]|nr:DNA replication and repair protein RecF [Pyramidobacter sp.]
MNISRTRWSGFRNLENASVPWESGLNLLCGANGSGKTNILEALHIVTGWGALSGSRTCDTVKWGETKAFLAAQTDSPRQCVAEASLGARASLRLDGKACRWGDLRHCVQSLTFLPADMALIEGSPAVRRRFLDVLCALFYPLYALKLSEYRRIVQNKRHLLALGKSVAVTHCTMQALAAWIWECRGQVCAQLTRKIELWENLLPRQLSLTLRRGGGGNAADPSEDFAVSCALYEQRERAARTPLVGPHRDDLVLACQNRPASSVFSRGQRRRAALALIMTAASAVEERFRTSPVLLLDEVTSELDERGRQILLDCLSRSNWQVFAATAEIPPSHFDGALWRVDAGRIARG